MIFIKKTLPLIITFVTGMIMIIAFFSGEGTKIKTLEEILPIWIQIIMTFTMVLGSISLLRINIQKINRKADGWGYSVVLLVGFFVMAFLGFVGGSFGNDYSFNSTPMGYYLVSDDGLSSKTVTVIDGNKDQNGLITPTKEGKVIISFKDNEGKDIQKTVSADQVKTRTMATLKNLEMFMFNGIFKSAQSTMFSLLAFFVASASFRAFRIWSVNVFSVYSNAWKRSNRKHIWRLYKYCRNKRMADDISKFCRPKRNFNRRNAGLYNFINEDYTWH